MAFERDQLGRVEPHELPMINNRLQDNQSLGKEKARYLAIPGFPYLAPPAGLELGKFN